MKVKWSGDGTYEQYNPIVLNILLEEGEKLSSVIFSPESKQHKKQEVILPWQKGEKWMRVDIPSTGLGHFNIEVHLLPQRVEHFNIYVQKTSLSLFSLEFLPVLFITFLASLGVIKWSQHKKKMQ
jgi:hypothetical protein